MATMKIDIAIANNTVVCSPVSGHVRGHKGDDISWESNHKFSLFFALLTGRGEQNWPFTGSPAKVSEVTRFKGTLASSDENSPPAYKYTVVIDGFPPLDPIIIVEK
jgi:hypothetical protein